MWIMFIDDLDAFELECDAKQHELDLIYDGLHKPSSIEDDLMIRKSSIKADEYQIWYFNGFEDIHLASASSLFDAIKLEREIIDNPDRFIDFDHNPFYDYDEFF